MKPFSALKNDSKLWCVALLKPFSALELIANDVRTECSAVMHLWMRMPDLMPVLQQFVPHITCYSLSPR